MPLADVGKDFPYYAMVGRYLRRVRGRSFRTRAPSLFVVGLDDDQWRARPPRSAPCRGGGARVRARWGAPGGSDTPHPGLGNAAPSPPPPGPPKPRPLARLL